MFDLEKSIVAWRKHMFAAGIRTPARLEELESHLREDVEIQIKSGVNGEMAFEVSARRIGQARLLGTEFKKNSSAREIWERWATRFVLYYAGAAGCGVMAMAANALLKADITSWNRVLGLAAVALSMVAILGGRYIHRFFPALSGRRLDMARIVCMVPAILWIPIYANVMLPHANFDQFSRGGWFVATLWTIALLPVSYRLWRGFDEASIRSISTAT